MRTPFADRSFHHLTADSQHLEASYFAVMRSFNEVASTTIERHSRNLKQIIFA